MNREEDISVLVVDDDHFVCETVSSLLREYGYSVGVSESADDAVRKFRENRFNVVLTDVVMPKVSGVDLLEKIHAIDTEVPVILMTAYTEFPIAVDAVKKGAFDFIIKPYQPEYLLHSIKKATNYYDSLQSEKKYKLRLEEEVKKRTLELRNALVKVESLSKEFVLRLTTVAEFRDTETGAHIKRIGSLAEKLAEGLNMSKDFIETITFASTMHDIGKIAIADGILLKQNRLTPEEFEVMKTHTMAGAKMLAGSTDPIIKTAETIALTHHERWDGSGYPFGLKGESIPVEGRIVILVDQYDALRSERPYKKPFSHEETLKIITKGDKRTMPEHFDPKMLKVFIELAPIVKEIFASYQD